MPSDSDLGAPSTGYGAPSYGFGAPSTGYGAPSYGFGAPSYGYGASSYRYGPPSTVFPRAEEAVLSSEGQIIFLENGGKLIKVVIHLSFNFGEIINNVGYYSIRFSSCHYDNLRTETQKMISSVENTEYGQTKREFCLAVVVDGARPYSLSQPYLQVPVQFFAVYLSSGG